MTTILVKMLRTMMLSETFKIKVSNNAFNDQGRPHPRLLKQLM